MTVLPDRDTASDVGGVRCAFLDQRPHPPPREGNYTDAIHPRPRECRILAFGRKGVGRTGPGCSAAAWDLFPYCNYLPIVIDFRFCLIFVSEIALS
jgi:hypothetical protein